MRRWVTLFTVAALVVPMGCAKRTGLEPPCGVQGVSRVDLGHPSVSEMAERGEYAQFTTKGGELFVTAYNFSHGILDPKIGATTAYFGSGIPQVDEDTLNVLNADLDVGVVEDDFTAFELEAGTYWTLTGTAFIEIVSCDEGGVSNPVPVPPYALQEPNFTPPPCGPEGASRADLGSPTYERYNRYQDLSHYARFGTHTETVYVTVSDVEPGQFGDLEVPYALVEIGVGTPRRSDNPLNVGSDKSIRVPENGFVQVELRTDYVVPFWVLTTPAANVSIISCEESGVYGVRSASPAPAAGPSQ